MIYVAVAAGLVIWFAIRGISKFVKTHGMHALIWRHLSGHSYDGVQRSKAGWFHGSGEGNGWHHLPRIKRAGYRISGTVLIILLAWGFVTRSLFVIIPFILVITAMIVYTVTWYVKMLHRLYAGRGLVRPLALALAALLDLPEPETEKNIIIAPDYLKRKKGELGQITLPPRFRATPAQREAVTHLVTSRLPVDVDMHWHTSVNPQFLTIEAATHPPDRVPFANWAEFMHDLPAGEILLGIDKGGNPYTGMLGDKSENPNIGVSSLQGRGKSTMLVCTAAQILHKDRDSDFIGIDPKMSSLDALAGLPNVTLACDPANIEQMWSAIDRYHADMMERLRILKRSPGEKFPVSLLTIDEANTCASIWSSWWNGSPDSPKTTKDSRIPQVWRAIAESGWMGRAACKNLCIVGQRLDSRATGGFGLRDSLGLIGLGGFRANQYRMLVDQTGTPPRAPRIKGRWLYFDGNETTWVQNLVPDIGKLREYALDGRTVAA